MKAKDKELLLQDLCARLPYRVKGQLAKVPKHFVIIVNCIILNNIINDLSEVRPYLFPMSTLSLTDEEIKEYQDIYASEKCNEVQYKYIDWLNKHHFDYRGLIEKGLAIDATDLNIY